MKGSILMSGTDCAFTVSPVSRQLKDDLTITLPVSHPLSRPFFSLTFSLHLSTLFSLPFSHSASLSISFSHTLPHCLTLCISPCLPPLLSIHLSPSLPLSLSITPSISLHFSHSISLTLSPLFSLLLSPPSAVSFWLIPVIYQCPGWRNCFINWLNWNFPSLSLLLPLFCSLTKKVHKLQNPSLHSMQRSLGESLSVFEQKVLLGCSLQSPFKCVIILGTSINHIKLCVPVVVRLVDNIMLILNSQRDNLCWTDCITHTWWLMCWL